MSKEKIVERGFTLVELMLVIFLIGILSSVVFLRLQPSKRLADSRNAARYSDLNALLLALEESRLDNQGNLPSCLTNDLPLTQIGTCSSGGSTLCSGAQNACIDLASILSEYIPNAPIDPKIGSMETTGYSIQISSAGSITLSSCTSEENQVVSVSR